MYPSTMFVATISDVWPYISNRGDLSVKITFTAGQNFRQSCVIREAEHIKQMYSWANVDSFYNLIHKKFGIKVHEDFGFITAILDEHFSGIFLLCE